MKPTEEQDGTERYGQYAGFVTRLLAFLIDLAICFVVVTIMTLTTRFVSQTLSLSHVTTVFINVLTLAVEGVFVVLYFVLLVTLAGQTPGKNIMGLRIVAMDGGPVRLGYAFRRGVAYILSFPLLWGFLLMLVDDRRQDFPDKFARTFVIYSWPVPPTVQLATPLKDRIARRRAPREATSQPKASAE